MTTSTIAFLRRSSISALVLFGVLLLSFNTRAQQSCSAVFQIEQSSNYQILGDLRVNEKKPIVKQCAQSCYFEAAVSVIESRLSRYLNSEVQIARPMLFAQLMLYRLEHLTKPEYFSRDFFQSRGGVLDVTSKGSTYLMNELLNENPIPLVVKKTQAAVYLEDKKIQRLYNQVGSYLDSRLTESQIQGANQFHGSEADERFRKALAGVVPELRFSLNRAFDNSPEMLSVVRDKGLGLRLDTTGLVFEMDTHYQPFIEPKTEAYILRRLKQTGELFLGYFHVRQMVHQKEGRDGFLELPSEGSGPFSEGPASKAKLARLKMGGDHAVAVVDVLLNKQGRITHFMARNSWGGMGKSDHGYLYISVEYLDFYGGSIHDWTPFERYQRK